MTGVAAAASLAEQATSFTEWKSRLRHWQRGHSSVPLTSPSSFHTCPDLSSLQISRPDSASRASVGASDSGERETATGLPRCPSPESLALRSRSRKLASTGKRASKKARSVLGRVRALQRSAAAKMAPSPIKIDTNVATKRGRSQDSDEIPADSLIVDQGASAQRPHSNVPLPPFLCQSYSEIHEKFDELEWRQRRRVHEGTTANDGSHRWALETGPEAKARNRYMNVLVWANSRIRLKVPEGESDFINASPIVLKASTQGEERRYIATQGPVTGQIAYFWHMVFHESKEEAVVVMLTQTVEAGREKCAQYFPLDQEKPTIDLQIEEEDPFINDEARDKVKESMSGRVTLLESHWDESCRSQVRKLELTIGSESKIVWHFLFGGWADYSKPEGEDRQALLELLKASESKSTTPDNPRVVHCSAGVGRTGTFIALDYLLKELDSGALLEISDPQVDPVFDTVDHMREQRMMMVYNEMQLLFIYEVIREQAELRLGHGKENDGRTGSKDGDPDIRSPKMARLSSDSDYRAAEKPELQPV
ncbi:protein-tyrosine phosphatase 2 [Paecilomyces variotii]|uniref:Protein-tyrosine phosphatase 2 n=1 Tax=Byssochlamys spectabilis TaxID=264951 RepID=A0A443HNS2_BYSSP|nr:protein-tyrosine phosphatase 2 [Paecilomyces variotii]RWQ93473.1 protein-tyrosine phosphatase 2 [Paecilomyces variotii]